MFHFLAIQQFTMSSWPLCPATLLSAALYNPSKKSPISSFSFNDHDYQFSSLSTESQQSPSASAQKCQLRKTAGDHPDADTFRGLHSHFHHHICPQLSTSSATCDHNCPTVNSTCGDTPQELLSPESVQFSSQKASPPLLSQLHQPSPLLVSTSASHANHNYSGTAIMKSDDTSLLRSSALPSLRLRGAQNSQRSNLYTKQLLYYICILVITFSTFGTSNGQQSGGGKPFLTTHKLTHSTLPCTSSPLIYGDSIRKGAQFKGSRILQ